jgi:hypothetical protein
VNSKVFEKQEQATNTISRRKEIQRIRVVINEMETKIALQKISETELVL